MFVKYIFLAALAALFAVNMGGSGTASSFAASYGSRAVRESGMILLFTLFAFLGAFIAGGNVARTLGSGIIPVEFMRINEVLVILISATATLTLANLLRLPQSTSMVTVGAIIGVGLFHGGVFWKRLLPVFSAWILLPVLSFILTFFLYRIVYPPSGRNLWIYEKFFRNERNFKLFTLFAGCYGAFAIGTNNLANLVGPLAGAGIVSVPAGLLLAVPFLGLGGFIFGRKTVKTFSSELVPLGTISAPLISLVTGTMLIIASLRGLPFPYVQLTAFSILAVSSVKNGHRHTMGHNVVKKIMLIWTITPVISAGLGFSMLKLFSQR